MKIVKLTEKDIRLLVKKVLEEQEKTENILSPVKNVYSGLKGVWRGDGYDYYKYLSSLRESIKDLKKLDVPNHKIMKTLESLSSKIKMSKMDDRKKNNIIDAIGAAKNHFDSYSKVIDDIERLINKKID